MKLVLPPAATAILLLAIGPAIPQSVQQLPIASVTCGDLAKASPAYQAALVYYAAGYRDGLDYAMALNSAVAAQPASASANASSSPSPVPAAPSSAASSSASAQPTADTSASNGPVVGGLSLQAKDVLSSCAGSPAALLTDIIANRGGGQGIHATPSSAGTAPTGNVSALATSFGPATGAEAASAPTGTTSTGTNAVSADLQGASQQLQQSISSGTPPPASAAAPAPPASSP